LQEASGLYALVRRELVGTEYYKGQLYRSAIFAVWKSLDVLVRLLAIDLAAALEDGLFKVQGTPSLISCLARTDPTWDGGAAFLVDDLTGEGNIGDYALLFVPPSWRLQAGWYALRVEPIQRALAGGLVVTRTDGWSRGFAFCGDEERRRCETIGEAYRHIQGEAH
jgi:hypothetical protein